MTRSEEGNPRHAAYDRNCAACRRASDARAGDCPSCRQLFGATYCGLHQVPCGPRTHGETSGPATSTPPGIEAPPNRASGPASTIPGTAEPKTAPTIPDDAAQPGASGSAPLGPEETSPPTPAKTEPELSNLRALRNWIAKNMRAEGDPAVTPEKARAFGRAFFAAIVRGDSFNDRELAARHGLTTAAAKPIMLRELGRLALVEEFYVLFWGNPLAHYVFDPEAEKEGKKKYHSVKRSLTFRDVAQHLAGTRSALSIPIDQEGLSRWGAIDLDRHNPDDPPVDHADLARRVTSLGRPLVVCKSRSGKGAWLFLSWPV